MGKKENDLLNRLNTIKTDKRASNATFNEYEKNKSENIENVKLEKLNPTRINAEYFNDLPKAEYDNLKADIKKNGILTPLIVDTNNNILAGHQRYRIAKELKLETIPCIQRTFKSETDKELFLVNDNLLRRHLTKEQKSVIIALIEKKHGIKYKRGNPNFTNRQNNSELDENSTNKEVSENLDYLKSNISDRNLRKGRAFIKQANDNDIQDVIQGKATIKDKQQKKTRNKKTPAKKTKPELAIEFKGNDLIIKDITGNKTKLIKAIEKQFKLNITEFK